MFWPGLPVGEAVQRRAGDRSEPSGRRGGPESENGRRSSSARPSGQLLDRPSGLLFRYLGRSMSRALFAWAEPLFGKPVCERPRVYESDSDGLVS